MASQLNNFGPRAQLVWAAPTREEKLGCVKEMIAHCVSNMDKKRLFYRQTANLSSGRLDRFAADLMLVDTDRRIK